MYLNLLVLRPGINILGTRTSNIAIGLSGRDVCRWVSALHCCTSGNGITPVDLVLKQ